MKLVALVSCLLVVATCAFEWDDLDPRQGELTASSSTGGIGGSGAAAGSGGDVTSTGGGGHLGGGGSMPALVDRGLVARYYIDEANSGFAPGELVDAHATADNLAIDYYTIPDPPVGGAGGTGGTGGAGAGGAPPAAPDMEFTEVAPAMRGLTWADHSQDGRAAALIDGGDLEALNGATQATIECVAQVLRGNPNASRILHIGMGSENGRLAMCTESASNLQLRLNNRVIEEWDLADALLERSVLHYVLDTTLTDVDERLRLYVDGVDQGPGVTLDSQPALDETLTFAAATLALGNRSDGKRSLEGTIYYCALYAAALGPTEVAENAALLAVSDDHP